MSRGWKKSARPKKGRHPKRNGKNPRPDSEPEPEPVTMAADAPILRLPNELLLQICAAVRNGKRWDNCSLAKLGRTNKRFHDLTQHMLYEEIGAGRTQHFSEIKSPLHHFWYPDLNLPGLVLSLAKNGNLASLIKILRLEDYNGIVPFGHPDCHSPVDCFIQNTVTPLMSLVLSRYGLHNFETMRSIQRDDSERNTDMQSTYNVLSLRMALLLLCLSPNVTSFRLAIDKWDMAQQSIKAIIKPHFGALKHLSLTNRKLSCFCHPYQSNGIPFHAIVWFLRASPVLESLAVTSTVGPSIGRGRQLPARANSHITSLVLNQCYLSRRNLEELIEACSPRLTEFRLTRVYTWTWCDAAGPFYASSWNWAEARTWDIPTPDTVIAMLVTPGAAVTIEKLTISEEPKVRGWYTPGGTPRNISLEGFHSVKELKLGGAAFRPFDTDDSLARLLKDCPKLESLTIELLGANLLTPYMVLQLVEAARGTGFNRLKLVSVGNILSVNWDNLKMSLVEGDHIPALENAGIRFLLRPLLPKDMEDHYDDENVDGFFYDFDGGRGRNDAAWKMPASELVGRGEITEMDLHEGGYCDWIGAYCEHSDDEDWEGEENEDGAHFAGPYSYFYGRINE
ncbi:hypothetical protein OQA88_889 [Cercophora sp. LCS_1]